MPVNTAAYEILFEFTNDTPDAVNLTGPSGRSVLVESGQDVVLVELSLLDDAANRSDHYPVR